VDVRSGGSREGADASPRSARLVRRADRRVIAGVAGGIADTLGVNPIWVRLGFLVLLLGAGAGVLLYLALWWLVPREDLPESGAQEFLARFPDAPAWVGRVVLIAGVAVLASQIAPDPDRPEWSPTLVAGFALIALGIALFRRDVAREGDRTAATEAPSGPRRRPVTSRSKVLAPLSTSRVRTPRERSRLGVLTSGFAMIALSVAVLLDGLGAISLDVGRFPAITLVVLGAGLLVGAWRGRARGAIVLGVLILPVALVMSLIHLPFGGEIASRTVYPRTADPFPTTQRLFAGNLFINLLRADLAGSTHRLDVEVGVGTVQLMVPPEVTIHLVADVGMGRLGVPGYPDRVGVDAVRDVTLPGKPGGGALIVRIEEGIGGIDVVRSVLPRKARPR
jgi:phage shock protein PspC (stress-responsive transcriptional regulator)